MPWPVAYKEHLQQSEADAAPEGTADPRTVEPPPTEDTSAAEPAEAMTDVAAPDTLPTTEGISSPTINRPVQETDEATMEMSDLLVAAEAAAQSLAMGDHIKHTPAPIPTVSAPDESESDSSSDDSDSDSDSDESSGDMASQDDGGTGKDRAEQLEGVVNALCAEDDEPIQGAPRTKNELVEPPQSVDDDDILHPISTSEPLTGPIGHVSSFIVESPSQGVLVVRGCAESMALNEDSLLCLENRRPIGTIAEVFGPVKMPHYTVYMSAKAMDLVSARSSLTNGVSIFSVSKRSHYITLSTLNEAVGTNRYWQSV